MKAIRLRRRLVCLLLILVLPFSLAGCVSTGSDGLMEAYIEQEVNTTDTSGYLVAVEDEPDTVDFQCTTIYYTVATNVFDRLVEMENDENGEAVVVPSLAREWEISDDGLRYTFHLRKNVRFSNGAELTSSDVRYTFERLLTHPESCNRDIVEVIAGAQALERGTADRLEGFEILDELSFVITLEEPFAAFLACLSMPGASILDEDVTREAGERFGHDPEWTIGTGPFILQTLEAGKGMTLSANPDCWQGPPKCDGLDLRFMTESEAVRIAFESGGLDILDLDELGDSAEFFLHGDIYQDRLYQVQRIAITYIALNESVEPLNSTAVRRALQLALNRGVLLDAVYGGRGSVENGIFPRGLYGYNPELPEIPYAPDEAQALLREAGYPDGFDMTVTVKASATQWELTLMRLAVSMWEKVGVRAAIDVVEESEFMRLRKSGQLACYSASWTADFDDPDNFIYTFFGSKENTTFRSLCYPRQEIIERVRKARTITDPDERLQEYRELERIIIQEDAAWIPLFSRLHSYVAGPRVDHISSTWMGSVKNLYREVSIKTSN